MNVESIKVIFDQNGIVKFKLYGLDYTIEKVENGVAIYADLYNNQKSIYDSLDSVLKNHSIYNEDIESNDSKIQNIH